VIINTLRMQRKKMKKLTLEEIDRLEKYKKKLEEKK
jgi:hypothetical protein